MLVCKSCRSLVYESDGWYYHDVQPRLIATRANEVTEEDEAVVRARKPRVRSKAVAQVNVQDLRFPLLGGKGYYGGN